MDSVRDVLPCEESYRPDKAFNAPSRNKLVRQSSQDHEQHDEMTQVPSLTHSDSGHGRSIGLGESQDEDSNTGVDAKDIQTRERLSHANSGHGQSFVLGESQDEVKRSCAIQRSASQPGTDTKGHKTPMRLAYSGYAQGQFLTLGENQHKTLHSIQRSASQPGPDAQSHDPPRSLTHSDSGQGPSIALGESQEEESIYHNDVKSPSSSGVVSNGDCGRPLSNDTMNYLDPHHGPENIDSGIEKTPSIPGTIFPFPPKIPNIVHNLEVSTDAHQIVSQNDIGTRDQKKKELEGAVHLGNSDPPYYFTSNYNSFSDVSSDLSNVTFNDSSISSPECSVFTSSYCPESRQSMPCPPMVSRSNFDQLSRELYRKEEEIETLQKSFFTLKKESDEKIKDFLSLINSAEIYKRELDAQLFHYREQYHRQIEITIQLKGKIEELNNLLQDKNNLLQDKNNLVQDKNKYIEQIEKENNDLKTRNNELKTINNELKTRNDIVEEHVEKLWKKEQQHQENVRQDQELNFLVRQNVFSVDDTIPKEPFSSPNLNIKSLPK